MLESDTVPTLSAVSFVIDSIISALSDHGPPERWLLTATSWDLLPLEVQQLRRALLDELSVRFHPDDMTAMVAALCDKRFASLWWVSEDLRNHAAEWFLHE